ncbi:MAG: phage tail tape measure protein [Agathobacter sp.]
MANSNEAKIKFKAETAEFDSVIKRSKNETKELNAEMKLAASEFKNSGDAAEYLGKKHDLLERKLEENKKQQEALSDKIEVATEIYGEDSEEVGRLETQLTNCRTAEQNIVSEINDCNSALEEHTRMAEESESALGQLSSEIESQQSELDALKQQYIETALEMGSDSDEAQNLANQISTLSEELQTNKERLEEVNISADSFDKTIEATGQESTTMGNLFGGAIGGMAQAIAAGGIAGAVSEMIDLAVELGKEAVELANDWSESTAVMAEGTGATGEQLKELTSAAYDAYKQISDVNASAQSVAGTLAELNTRLGLTGEDATVATEMFSQFAKVTGQDAEGAVDDIVDAMKRWGTDIDIANIEVLLDDITTASQNCSLSASEMTGLLSDNAYQFKELGYSTEEALGFITAMADGGMNTSQMNTALRNSVKNLTDATDDVPGAFQEAIRMIQEADGDASVLNATIGDTGKTIEETFGTKAAQEMVLSLSTSGDSVDEFTQKLLDNSGSMKQTYDDSITLKDEWARLGNGIKGSVSQTIGPACTEAVGFFADLFDKNSDVRQGMQKNAEMQAQAVRDQNTVTKQNIEEMKNAFGNFKSKVGEVTEGIGQNMVQQENAIFGANINIGGSLSLLRSDLGISGNAFGSMKDIAVSHLSDLKEKANTKMENIKGVIKGGADKLKSAFDFRWSLPKIELPHFSIKGKFSLNPPSHPTFSVSWYKKAVDTPYLLRGATVFGQDSNGNFLGGGETKDEMIFGKDRLMSMIEDAVNRQSEIQVTGLEPIVDAIKNMKFVMNINGRSFMATVAGDADAELGTRQFLTSRGLSL